MLTQCCKGFIASWNVFKWYLVDINDLNKWYVVFFNFWCYVMEEYKFCFFAGLSCDVYFWQSFSSFYKVHSGKQTFGPTKWINIDFTCNVRIFTHKSLAVALVTMALITPLFLFKSWRTVCTIRSILLKRKGLPAVESTWVYFKMIQVLVWYCTSAIRKYFSWMFEQCFQLA